MLDLDASTEQGNFYARSMSDGCTTSQSRRRHKSTVDYASLGGIRHYMSSAEVAVKTEHAMLLLKSGKASTQAEAAAAAGVNRTHVVLKKLEESPPHATLVETSKFVEVELAPGVTFTKEQRTASGQEAPGEAQARAGRNYRSKLEAIAKKRRGELDGEGAGSDDHDWDDEQLREQDEEESNHLWDEIMQLNKFDSCGGPSSSSCVGTSSGGCCSGASAGRGGLTSAIIERAGGLPRRRRNRSYQPHEVAALTNKQRRTVAENGETICICARCGEWGLFSIDLGRANALQGRTAAMHGAEAFVNHPVSLAVFTVESMIDSYGWRAAVLIPQRHCCNFEAALQGSAMRAEATALNTWQNELDLNLCAAKAVSRAIHVPLLEPAPCMLVRTRVGVEQLMGKSAVFILMNKDDVLPPSIHLRQLWRAKLSKTLTTSYKPLLVDEKLVKDVALGTVFNGCTVRSPNATWVHSTIGCGGLMLAVMHVDNEQHEAAAAAAAAMRGAGSCSGAAVDQHGQVEHGVQVLRGALAAAAVTHVLLPNGAKLNVQAEARANEAEASALGVSADSIHRQSFDRTGSSSGIIDAENAVERLSQSYDVFDQACKDLGSEMEFIAATDNSKGVRAVALSYIAGAAAQPRKRKAAHGADGGHLCNDGPGQPRMLRAYNSIPGVQIDGAALAELQEDRRYMEQVREPQMLNAMQMLLTLRHHRYGGAAIGHTNQKSCPFAKASSTIVRICAEQDSVNAAGSYIACSTMAAVNCGNLAVHVDGAKKLREPTAEIVSTRWAAMMKKYSSQAAKEAALDEARKQNQLQSTTCFLRSSIAFSVAPCSGLGIVAGSDDEHGVPEPEAGEAGDEVERGLTRSFAQSLRPDDATARDLPSFDDEAVRRVGLRQPPRPEPEDAGAAGPRQAAGANRPVRDRQAPQQFVPGADNTQLRQQLLPHHRRQGVVAPPQGWGRARVNRRTGTHY